MQIKFISVKTIQSETSRDPHGKKSMVVLTYFTLIWKIKQNITGLSKFFQLYKLKEIKICSKGFYDISGAFA